MSEQEKKSGSGAGGSSVVLVDQQAAGRHKQPFRPTELQEEAPDLHHKRSRAPAVPSVAEELKDNANSETKDQRECERGEKQSMSSEKQKHSNAKKLSSNVKRRGSSPESITLAQLAVDTKRGTVTPPTLPIPAQVSSVASVASDLTAEKSLVERKEEDDSITDEIAELRTPEVAKKASEWGDKSHDTKRKVASWNDEDYQKKVKVQEIGAKSHSCVLERKRSIGPCFRSSAPFGRPSGIAICLPTKNVTPVIEESNRHQSVINITLSKKCLVSKTRSYIENPDGKQCNQIPQVSFFGTLKEKLSNMTGKIRDALND